MSKFNELEVLLLLAKGITPEDIEALNIADIEHELQQLQPRALA